MKLPARRDTTPAHGLSIVVDRGDIWYDLPFDDKGTFKQHRRKKYPTLSLMVTHGGKTFPLARWRTTIGGWRAEQATDGYEYFRYKMSDVGPRVIRQIVSGPVWIPPTSTPIRSLVKGKNINHSWTKLVNYDELGPGFRPRTALAGYSWCPARTAGPTGTTACARTAHPIPLDLQRERLLARLPPAANQHRGALYSFISSTGRSAWR